MKYSPWKSNQSYMLYLVTLLYAASLAVILFLGLLEQTPILWAYLIVCSLGEMYFLVTVIIEYVNYFKGRRFIIKDETITFFDEEKGKLKTISYSDVLEFKYKKKGQIHFVYKKHGRCDFDFTVHVLSKKECDILDQLVEYIAQRDAKVDLKKE